MSDLFSQPNALDEAPTTQELGPGITLIKGLVPSSLTLKHIQEIIGQAPLRHMMTPMGHTTKISMTNCGDYGWVSSLHGYTYSPTDPLSHQPWPEIPQALAKLAHQAALLAGIDHFIPDACLVNQYEVGQSLGRHQDKDEADFNWPIVSFSIGLQAIFQVFATTQNSGHAKSSQTQNILLQDGDALVVHGPARLRHHGIKTVKADLLQPNLQYRYNLTFRKAR